MKRSKKLHRNCKMNVLPISIYFVSFRCKKSIKLWNIIILPFQSKLDQRLWIQVLGCWKCFLPPLLMSCVLVCGGFACLCMDCSSTKTCGSLQCAGFSLGCVLAMVHIWFSRVKTNMFSMLVSLTILRRVGYAT